MTPPPVDGRDSRMHEGGRRTWNATGAGASVGSPSRHSPARARLRTHWALIGIDVPTASGTFSSVTVSRPFLKTAFTLSSRTVHGSCTVRAKEPYTRSLRYQLSLLFV